ncbi:MAG: 4-hydroxy-tetrahydrodipicolinate reductase [bacterium]
MPKVLINGAKGKMGVAAVEALGEVEDLDLCLALDMGDDVAAEVAKTPVDVVLDLTHPNGLKDRVAGYLALGLDVVVGATGLSAEDKDALVDLASAKNKTVLICPNFSISALLLMKFSAEAAKYMPRVEIIEYHHDQKADAPSGTAIKTADMIQQQDCKVNDLTLDEKEMLKGARGGKSGDIPIHAVRLPGFVADQDVIFGGLDQTLMIRQTTLSRKAFMPGVLLALRKYHELGQGVFDGLEKVLFG